MEKMLLEHLWVVAVVLLLTLPIKAAALWRAARRGQIGWFLTLIILNSLAILDLFYLFVFSDWGLEKKEQQQKQQEDEFCERPQVRQSSLPTNPRNRQTFV